MKMKRILGAAAAVLMLTLASSAHSAVMIANIRGDYNDAPEWMTWRVTLMYDTDLLTHNTVGGDYYTWTAASGDPHALLSAKGVYGYSSPPYTTTFNVTEFTSFTINRSWGLIFVRIQRTRHQCQMPVSASAHTQRLTNPAIFTALGLNTGLLP